MASTKIRGISIEIGGDTSGLSKALKDVNSEIRSTQNQLKDVERLLKLDPTNTELLAQKQRLLSQSADQTAEKLKQLRAAEQALRDSGVDETSEQFMALNREIISVQNSLVESKEAAAAFSAELDNAPSKVESLKNKLYEASDATAELSKAASGILAGAGAAAGAAITSYADYEQIIGGVETLFGEAQSIVENYANEAYKTAGLSANKYMETVVGFSAALINSLGGNTKQAAEVANVAIIDMADNANKFGSDMQSVMAVYSSLARGIYTTLDNLKLGYGGTKTELERLLADAEKVSGIHYDIGNYNDVILAIHEIQNQMGITGTTALEAEETIQGSFATLKAAIANLTTGLGMANSDMDALTSAATEAAAQVASNLAPVLENIWNNIPDPAQWALGITAVVAAISPVSAGIASLISVMQTLHNVASLAGTAFSTFGTAAAGITLSPLALEIAGIAAAIAALSALIISNWDTIKGIIAEAKEAMAGFAQNFMNTSALEGANRINQSTTNNYYNESLAAPIAIQLDGKTIAKGIYGASQQLNADKGASFVR